MGGISVISRFIIRAACAASIFAGLSLASVEARAAEVLGWAYAATGVGHCTALSCTVGGNLTYNDQTDQFGHNQNASSSASDPTWGLSQASAAPGVGALALPQLHSDVSGSAFKAGAFSWVYSFAQGAEGFTWNGPSMDFAVSDFIGTLNYNISGSGFGQVDAALAILTSAVGVNALGDAWFKDDGNGGFLNSCASEGAIGVGDSGVISVHGSGSVNVTPACGGATTFHLNTGDDFGLWARIETFEANGGSVDASHSFTVALNPNLSPETAALLEANLVRNTSGFGTVPEPGAWALMLMGFGGLGAALRTRRRGATASA